ncbi:MAG: hypothetical protein IPH09_13285 [bacterium]|nr:hypothetical protein [bacterium]
MAGFVWYHARTNRGAVVLADLSGDGPPSPLGSVTVYGAPTRLVLAPPWLYCGVRGTGAGINHHLLVIDVADPAAPQLSIVWSMSYAAEAMALEGDRLWLARPGRGAALPAAARRLPARRPVLGGVHAHVARLRRPARARRPALRPGSGRHRWT